MNSFEAYILTPEGAVFRETVIGVKMPGTLGSFEVKTGHASIISTLEPGELVVRKTDGDTLKYAVSGGLAEMNDNVLNLLAEAAEPIEEIDLERAQESKKRADERLSNSKSEVDRDRAEKSLARAKNRIKLYKSINAV